MTKLSKNLLIIHLNINKLWKIRISQRISDKNIFGQTKPCKSISKMASVTEKYRSLEWLHTLFLEKIRKWFKASINQMKLRVKSAIHYRHAIRHKKLPVNNNKSIKWFKTLNN